jgi:hypothetical protein
MKKILLALFIAPLLILTACTTAVTSASPLPHSMKGYELYSWQQAGEWRFTLILGTNRVKYADEIIPVDKTSSEDDGDIRGIGLDKLLGTLARLPRNEWLFWNTLKDTETRFPPQEIIDQVTARADQLGIQLAVAPLYG